MPIDYQVMHDIEQMRRELSRMATGIHDVEKTRRGKPEHSQQRTIDRLAKLVNRMFYERVIDDEQSKMEMVEARTMLTQIAAFCPQLIKV